MDMSSSELFLKTTATELLINILAAVAFWIIGRWLIGRVIALMQNGIRRYHVIPTLTKYLGSILGNGGMYSEPIRNYSVLPARRVERVAQLDGSVDPADAVVRLRAALSKVPHVLNTPALEVSLLDLNVVGSVIAVRPYCHHEHYWQVYFDTHRAIVRVCKEAGWPAPTPTYLTKSLQLSAACA